MPQPNESMKTEFTNAAEAAEFEKYRQKGLQAQQTLAAPTTTPGAPSAVPGAAVDPAAAKKPEWVKGAVPEASKIMEAGKKAKGLPDDWQPSAGGFYGSLKEADDVFRAGLEATGSNAVEYNMGQFGKAARMTKDGAVAAGKDVGKAIVNPGNTLQQIPSGLLNAWNEINEFGTSLDVTAAKFLGDIQILQDAAGIAKEDQSKPYFPALQIVDQATGKLDVKFLNLVDEAVQARVTSEAPLQVENKFEDPASVTGGIVEVVSQFMAPYSQANKALGIAGVLAKPGAWNTAGRATLAGYMTDFAAFDPEMGRVTDLAAQMGIEGEWVDYLKSDPDDSDIENRFKNALEGLGLNIVGEALFAVFRGTKGVKTMEKELGARIDELSRLDADAAARFEEDIYASGRPDGDTVIVTPPPRARTQAQVDAGIPARGTEPAPVVDNSYEALDLKFEAERDALIDSKRKINEYSEIERLVYDARTNSSVSATDEKWQSAVDVALANGRPDLALYIAQRAKRYADGKEVTPGVPESSPKYEQIKANLASARAAEQEAADAMLAKVGAVDAAAPPKPAAPPKSRADLEAELDGLMAEARAARQAGDPAALKAAEDKIDANLKARIDDVMGGRAPAQAGERYFERDFFDLAKAIDEEADFAFGKAVPSRQQFLEEEIVARTTENGDMIAFPTRAGEVGVKLSRGTNATIIEWDWLQNIAGGDAWSMMPRRLDNIRDANEIISKVMTVLEADAKSSNSPAYFFSGLTSAHEKIYGKLMPKLAERMGYSLQKVEGMGFLMVRNDVVEPMQVSRSILNDPPVNAADRAARARKNKEIRDEINRMTGYEARVGDEIESRAAGAMLRELEGRGAKFAVSGQAGTRQQFSMGPETVWTAAKRRERLDALRSEAKKWLGDSYKKLEQVGRIQYARRASDIDPKWADMDDHAMAVTMPGGQVFIFTETVQPGDMAGIVLHEAAVHAGLEKMVGARVMTSLLKSTEDLVRSGDPEAVRANTHARKQLGENADPRKLAEETFAYIVQNGIGPTLVREMITHVKTWVAKTFPGIAKSIKWTTADYEALALMALRSEAIIAGKLIAAFGKSAKVRRVGEFKMAPTEGGGGTRTLKASDRLDRQAAYRISQMDASVGDEALVTQVSSNLDDLLGSQATEYLFRNMDNFDPFDWRDAVEMVAQGAGTPEMRKLVREGISLFDDLTTDPKFRPRDFFEVSSPEALKYWEAARSEGRKAPALVLDATQQIFRPGQPDPNGFITTAESAIENLPKRVREAKALTGQKWRAALQQGGASREALETQVDRALASLGRGPDEMITKDELREAMARERPVVQAVEPKRIDDGEVGQAANDLPIANAIYEVQSADGVLGAVWRALPLELRIRLDRWSNDRLLEAAQRREDENLWRSTDPNMTAEADYSGYANVGQFSGYRQELIIMPDEAKGYRSHNWETEGVVGHIRTTDRVTTSGERVRHTDEIQSDINQEAVDEDYVPREGEAAQRKFDAYDAKLKEVMPKLDAAEADLAAARTDYLTLLRKDEAAADARRIEEERVAGPDFQQKPFFPVLESPETAQAYARLVAAGELVSKLKSDYDKYLFPMRGVPNIPLKEWERPFIRRVLQQALKDGVDVITFATSKTLNSDVNSAGTARFYDKTLPTYLKKVAAEIGAKVDEVELDVAEFQKADVRIKKEVQNGRWVVQVREKSGEWHYNKSFDDLQAAKNLVDELTNQVVKVPAIRLTPEAKARLQGGVPMFAMRETPGRMDDALNRTVLQDIKEGRRALDPEESEALLGAAERWAKAVAAQNPSKARSLQDIIEVARSRADPEAMRDLINMMEIAKSNVPEPPSLLTFLRRNGGLKEMEADYAGELRNRDLHTVNLVNNRSGKNLDDAALAAQEAGYIGQEMGVGDRATIDELLEAIDREMTGEKVYSRNDFDWVMEAATRKDMREEIARLGIDPATSKKSIMSEFERISAIQEGEPLTLRDFEANIAAEKAAGAQPGIGLPAKGLLGGNEIRINFNAIQAADDIRSIMGQLADAFANEILAARGNRPTATVIRDAKRQSAWDALNSRREGTPLADSEVLAAQSLYVTSAENVKQALDMAMKTGSDLAHYNARRAITLHRAIQAEIAGAKADASRALRAWGIPRSGTAQARRELNGVLEAYGGQLDPVEAARLRTMLDAEPEAADKAIRTMGTKVSDVGGAVLRFAWLSGPQTHIMNMAGNSLTTVFDIGIRLATGVRGKVLGDPVLERELSMAIKEYTGLMAGVRAQFGAFARRADYKRMGRRLDDAKKKISQGQYAQGLKQGASALALDNPVSATFRGRFDDRGVSGSQKYAAGGGEKPVSAEAFGMKQGTPAAMFVDGIGRILSAPTDFLGFQDDFFKGVNELAARYREAERMVLEEMEAGLPRDQYEARFAELVDNPPQSVLDEARLTAQRRTFTEPVGEGTRMLLTARNYMNKLGFPMGHILLPFVVTPSNILKFAFQNGPTGLLFREIQDDLKAGGTRAAMAQSRIAAGTGLLLLGMDLVAHGHMTGRGPSDPGERELWERSGKQEYSFKILDKWFQYRRLEPVSTMLAIGADLQTIFLNSELDDSSDSDLAELIGPVLGSAIQVVTSKTYLTSAAEFIRFTEDPERYGGSYIERLFASVTAPAILSQTEEVGDPVIREASNIMERWMSRMPGFSKDLPPSLDIWGRKRSVSSGLGGVYDTLSPFSVKTQDPEPIDQELSRIGFYPRRPDKAITVQTPEGISVSVNLKNRPDIWTRYVALAGNESKIFDGMGTKDYLNAVINKRHPDAADYYLLPDSATQPISKESFIKKRIEQGRLVARAQLQREFRADLQAMAVAATRAERAAELRREDLVPQ